MCMCSTRVCGGGAGGVREAQSQTPLPWVTGKRWKTRKLTKPMIQEGLQIMGVGRYETVNLSEKRTMTVTTQLAFTHKAPSI